MRSTLQEGFVRICRTSVSAITYLIVNLVRCSLTGGPRELAGRATETEQFQSLFVRIKCVKLVRSVPQLISVLTVSPHCKEDDRVYSWLVYNMNAKSYISVVGCYTIIKAGDQ